MTTQRRDYHSELADLLRLIEDRNALTESNLRPMPASEKESMPTLTWVPADTAISENE